MRLQRRQSDTSWVYIVHSNSANVLFHNGHRTLSPEQEFPLPISLKTTQRLLAWHSLAAIYLSLISNMYCLYQ